MTTLEMLNQDECWQAVETRDKSADGAFVYAVETTGVYCRPSCSSRQPRRDNVRFFALPAAAEQHGFRACKRCHPQDADITDPRLSLTQAVAEHLAEHADDSDSVALAALGAEFGYDPQHLQRTFKDVLGVTPKQYAEALRVKHFKESLKAGGTVLDAGFNAGYGSASRTYENGGQALGMTPAAYKRGGEGVAIRYTVAPTFLGAMLVAATERGLCAVGLYGDENEAADALLTEYPHAEVSRDDGELRSAVDAILAHINEGAPLDLPLDIQATAFQWRVWRELQRIPHGETRSYAEVAQAIGEPQAVRAVATACASNRAAIVIPCHRVVKSDSSLSGYRWGPQRKRELLAAEGRD